MADVFDSARPPRSRVPRISSGPPREAEGTRIFKPTEHPTYTGRFHLTGSRTTLVGRMTDQPPWDHMDYAGKHLHPVDGHIDIEVNDRTNTGHIVAEFWEGPDRYRIVFDRFSATQPFQDGGIATRVYEHGDSGNGDPIYPNLAVLAGWGKADVLKNGEPLYKDLLPTSWSWSGPAMLRRMSCITP